MAAEVVHDDDISGPEGGHKDLLDVVKEALAVDGAIEEAGSRNLVHPEGSEESQCFPMSVRHPRFQTATALAPASQRAMLVFTQVSSIKTSREASMRA